MSSNSKVTPVSRRRSLIGLAGLAASSFALAVNLAVAYAPGPEVPNPERPAMWQPATDKAYVAPPSR